MPLNFISAQACVFARSSVACHAQSPPSKTLMTVFHMCGTFNVPCWPGDTTASGCCEHFVHRCTPLHGLAVSSQVFKDGLRETVLGDDGRNGGGGDRFGASGAAGGTRGGGRG